MSLDVYVAQSLEQAACSEPEASIDLQAHTAFFRTGLATGKPLLQRLGDYFSDCRFENPELGRLIEEIDTVVTRIPNSSPYYRWMKDLRSACNKALAEGSCLFAVCD